MKKIKYLVFMLLAFVGVSTPLLAAETEDAKTYLSNLSYEQLQGKISEFNSKNQARMYSFAFNTDATPIGYTEWAIYKDGITEEDRNEKEEFFTNDCDSYNSEETSMNIIDGDHSVMKTTCVVTDFMQNIDASATDVGIKFSIKEGFGVKPSFALGINVNDSGNQGNLYINEDDTAHDYEYTLSDEAKSDKRKDKKADKSSKDKESKNNKKTDKKKSNKDDSMSVLTFSLIIGTAASVILLIVLIVVYILRRKKLKNSRPAQPQIGQF